MIAPQTSRVTSTFSAKYRVAAHLQSTLAVFSIIMGMNIYIFDIK